MIRVKKTQTGIEGKGSDKDGDNRLVEIVVADRTRILAVNTGSFAEREADGGLACFFFEDILSNIDYRMIKNRIAWVFA